MFEDEKSTWLRRFWFKFIHVLLCKKQKNRLMLDEDAGGGGVTEHVPTYWSNTATAACTDRFNRRWCEGKEDKYQRRRLEWWRSWSETLQTSSESCQKHLNLNESVICVQMSEHWCKTLRWKCLNSASRFKYRSIIMMQSMNGSLLICVLITEASNIEHNMFIFLFSEWICLKS